MHNTLGRLDDCVGRFPLQQRSRPNVWNPIVRYTPVIARNKNEAGAAIASFSRDVEKLQSHFATTTEAYSQLSVADRETLWEKVMDEAKKLREKWRDNPYIEVEGFSVSLSWLPSIDVRFAFKDEMPRQ